MGGEGPTTLLWFLLVSAVGYALSGKVLAPSKHSMSIIIIVAAADQDPLTRKARSTA